MSHLVIDADYLKYSIGSVCESRHIEVTHIPTGKVKEFKNRTDFWGRDRKHSGGWLAEINDGRDKPFLPEEFSIKDIQIAQPVQNAKKSVNQSVEKILDSLVSSKAELYIGRGKSFRNDLATIWEYKGKRDGTLRPLLLNEIEEHLIKKYKAKVITEIEADDACVISCYRTDKILVGVDKDYQGCPVNLYNPNYPEWGIQDCRDLGKLWLDDKDKVRGDGRMFMYYQICSEDDIDNYAANSASDVRWGSKSAYKTLIGSSTDREAFQKMSQIYRELYPEKKIIEGWKGDKFEIDWRYVLTENFHLARMLRWKGDVVDVNDLLKTFGCLRRNE